MSALFEGITQSANSMTSIISNIDALVSQNVAGITQPTTASQELSLLGEAQRTQLGFLKI